LAGGECGQDFEAELLKEFWGASIFGAPAQCDDVGYATIQVTANDPPLGADCGGGGRRPHGEHRKVGDEFTAPGVADGVAFPGRLLAPHDAAKFVRALAT
jgi:hypothetical protein